MATPGGQAFYFMDESLSDNTQDGSPQLTGKDDVFETKRGLLAQQLLQARSIDATALTALLDRIPSESDHRPVRSYATFSRSPTLSPPEDDDYDYEIKCYQALLDDNCRPLFCIDLLPHIEANPDAHANLLRPWSTQRLPGDVKGEWQALSRQWNQWKEFRAWQLRSRGRRPGFGEYLDARRRDYLMHGGTSRHAAKPEFEQAERVCWEREYGDYGEDEEDVERHAEFVRRLLPQEFVIRRPLRLLSDPKTQDLWTTYVEYLAFEAAWLCQLARDARRLEKRAKEKYEVAKAKVDEQQCRIDWVLSQIEKIEEEQEAAVGEGSSGKTGSSKKRRPIDDTDGRQNIVEPRMGKMGENTTDKDKTDETEGVPASRSNNLSQTRRSKRRRSSTDEQEEKDIPEPKSKRWKAASTGDGAGSVLQASGALAVSAVTTITTIHTSSLPRHQRPKRITTPPKVAAVAPEPRGERIETLRPRVNRKAETV